MTRRLLPWVPALACMVGIFIASAQHRVPLPDFRESDKVSHFAGYGVYGAALAFGGAGAGVGRIALIAAGSLYGASDEFHQSFVPGRSPDWRDWLADTGGVILGVLGTYSSFQRRRARAGRGGTPPHPAGADTLQP